MIAFAAEEVSRLKTGMDPADALAVLSEIKARWEKEGRGDPLRG